MNSKLVIIRFPKYKGKSSKIKWKDIEKKLKEIIGKKIVVEETNDVINIGTDFPDEFAGSKYTSSLRGAIVKVKANMSNVTEQLVTKAFNKRFVENKNIKHENDAKMGWERFDVNFGIKITNDNNGEYINVYCATMIIRIDKNGERYLYDFINIKKREVTPA